MEPSFCPSFLPPRSASRFVRPTFRASWRTLHLSYTPAKTNIRSHRSFWKIYITIGPPVQKNVVSLLFSSLLSPSSACFAPRTYARTKTSMMHDAVLLASRTPCGLSQCCPSGVYFSSNTPHKKRVRSGCASEHCIIYHGWWSKQHRRSRSPPEPSTPLALLSTLSFLSSARAACVRLCCNKK
jgi:hypothetical protein